MESPLEKMHKHVNGATRLLKSMANESRLMILCQLAQEELSVTDLGKRLPLSQSALSQHLGILRREGLVKTRREAQYIWYSLDSDEVVTLIQTLCELFDEQ